MLAWKRLLFIFLIIVIVLAAPACQGGRASRQSANPPGTVHGDEALVTIQSAETAETDQPNASASAVQPALSPEGSSCAEETLPPVDPVYTLGESPRYSEGCRQGVYYEIFVRAFADSNHDGVGDLKGLTSKLDYLNDANPETTQDLGVTGLWLMPVHPSPSYHGYDVSDYYAIHPDYGTMADFEVLLREAHQRGLSVMMDLVLNHTSDKHPWFAASVDPSSPYRAWYHWSKDGSEGYDLKSAIWGHPAWNALSGSHYLALFWSGMPDLNYDSPEVREEAKRIAGFWLDKGVDGFRLDAVPHIYDAREVLEGGKAVEKTVAWWREFTNFCHERKPGSLVIGEVLDENPATRATYLASLDATFHFGLANQIINALKGGKSKNGYLNTYITQTYTRYAIANPSFIDAPILSNHDMNRIIGLLGGKPEWMKIAASIYLTLEGLPFVYYGEELGQFGAKPDEDIRLPFAWGEEDSAQTFWRSNKYQKVTHPVSEQEGDSASLLTHYKRLIRVRNACEALYAGRFEASDTDNEAVLAYHMTSEHQTALVLHNLSGEAQRVAADTTGYTLVFCQTREGFEAMHEALILPPFSTVICVKALP